MKLGIISDGHLFQTFVERYDSIKDFGTVLRKIKNEIRPDMLLMAGDMFDYKKTQTAYLRHYEGESFMIKIRGILEEFGKPIYAIRGNHEKEEVLIGLQQTVKNFHYIQNNFIEVNDALLYFLDTHYEEGGLYDYNAVAKIIKDTISIVKTKKSKPKILILHESFAPFQNAIPKRIVQKIRKVFDWVVNGHMHMRNPASYGLKNVATLPALLPSKIVLGAYWMEKYSWDSSQNSFERKEKASPFGYAVLNTEKQSIEFYPFTPSRKIVEVAMETTNLSLKQVRDRFREILNTLGGREDKDDLIILPEIHGDADFLPVFVQEVSKEYPELGISELRNNTQFKIRTATGAVISEPLLSVEKIIEKVKKDIPEISKKLAESVGKELDERILEEILRGIFQEELLERIPSRVTTRLENLHEIIISKMKPRKPEYFDTDFKELIKGVKE